MTTPGAGTPAPPLECDVEVFPLPQPGARGGRKPLEPIKVPVGGHLIIGAEGAELPEEYLALGEETPGGLLQRIPLRLFDLQLERWGVTRPRDVPSVLLDLHHDGLISVGYGLDRPEPPAGYPWRIHRERAPLEGQSARLHRDDQHEIALAFHHVENGSVHTFLRMAVRVPAGPTRRTGHKRWTTPMLTRQDASRRLRALVFGEADASSRVRQWRGAPDSWLAVLAVTAELVAAGVAPYDLVDGVTRRIPTLTADGVKDRWRSAFGRLRLDDLVVSAADHPSTSVLPDDHALVKATTRPVAEDVLAKLRGQPRRPEPELMWRLCRELQLVSGFFPTPADVVSREAFQQWLIGGRS